MECDSISYELSTSFSLFPSDSYGNYLLNNSIRNSKTESISQNVIKNLKAKNLSLEEYIQKSLISLNLFYEEFKYTSINEVPKFTLIDLIANLGGIMGLFLGMSFLSFGEVIVIVFELFIVLFERK